MKQTTTGLRLAAATVLLITACDNSLTNLKEGPQNGPQLATMADGEGEVLGTVYGYTGTGELYIETDPLTSGGVGSPRLWLDRSKASPIEFLDTAADGGCNPLSSNNAEKHAPGPGLPATGTEAHCITPGTYLVTLFENSTPIRTLEFDYVRLQAHDVSDVVIDRVYNYSAGEEEFLETDNPSTPRAWIDSYLNFDLGSPSASSTLHLDVDHPGDPLASSFIDNPSPTGHAQDVFRFSVVRSTATGPAYNYSGRLLSRLWWDVGMNYSQRTGFYDSYSVRSGTEPRGIIRIHKFAGHVAESRTVLVGLEGLRPDNIPLNSPACGSGIVCRTIAVTAPPPPPADFVVTSVTSAGSFGQGGTGTVTVVVTNQGGSAAPPSQIGVFLSSDQTLGAGDINIGTLQDVADLGVSASRNEVVGISIPPEQTPNAYYLIGAVDVSGNQIEGNEQNNTGVRSGTINVTLMPDLVMDSVSRNSSTISRSSPGQATVWVRKAKPAGGLGGGAGGGSSYVTRVYLSPDPVWDASDVQVANLTQSAPNYTKSFSVTLSVPPSQQPGIYYLIGYIDATALIAESDEANNTRARIGQVTLVVP